MIEKLNQILQGLLTNPIIAISEDAGWSIKRYADKTFEAIRRYTGDIGIAQASGNMYVASNSEIVLPAFIAEESATITYCNVEVISPSWPVITAVRNITDSVLTYQAISMLPRASTSYAIVAKIEGKIAGGGVLPKRVIQTLKHLFRRGCMA